jgi:uncharacterized protein YndB with AHSA1/START domain
MATRKTAKKTAEKTEAPEVKQPKNLPIGKGPIGYTTSNVFKESMTRVWDAATKGAHLKKFFIDDMRGEFNSRLEPVGWFWKGWGWIDIKPLKYTRNKELVWRAPEMEGKYMVTIRFECVKKGNKTIFRVHESGYATKDLKKAFMMCEGWTEFHCGMKAHLAGKDMRMA